MLIAYITQVPPLSDGTLSSSNIDLCHDSTLTMSLGKLCFSVS